MWWFSRYPSHLPFAKGPYVPGCSDVMIDFSKDGQFFRIYYPTNYKQPVETHASHWITWTPNYCYFDGFAKVVMVWSWILRLITWLMNSGKMHIPLIYGAKVKKDSKLQCIVMSHGLGGCRFLYSTLCIELASRGYIVFALEHRDESSCKTYYYDSKINAQKDKKTFIEHSFVKLGSDHFSVRNSQVKKRAEECIKIIDLIHNINKGVIPENILKLVPTEKHQEFELEELVGLIDLDNLSIIGHSFGGATSLVAMSRDDRIKQGVLLDPWMFPVKNMNELTNLKQPIQTINTQTFHIASNIKSLQTIYEDKSKRPMYTILHSTHESQTDSIFIIGYWLNWFMKKLKPVTAARINNALVLQFLKKYTNNASDVSDCDAYLLKESKNVVEGLTKPWA